MNTQPRHRRPRTLAIAAALGLGLTFAGAAMLAAPANATGPAPDPLLSISVDNGRTSAEAGDKLDYTISVENLGSDAVTDLSVSQTMPPGLSFASADRGGSATKKMVVWSVDLEASGTVTLHTTMQVGATPDEVLRLATVACAAVSEKKAPIVCATHSDELPAGARAASESEAASQAAADQEESGVGAIAPIGGGLAILLVVGSAVLVVRRRRRDDHSPAATTSSSGL